jgi:histidinol phosphatase-like PHP family hydrolase
VALLQPNSKVVEINMAHNQVNEVDELLKGLKKVKGFKSYLVLNSDGIVIRWDQEDGQMSYQSAVQHGE